MVQGGTIQWGWVALGEFLVVNNLSGERVGESFNFVY